MDAHRSPLVSRRTLRLRRSAPVLATALAGALTLAGLAGCGSSSLSNVWRDPDYGARPIHNALVVALVQSPTTRRLWEDTFVAEIEKRGGHAMASYRLFPDEAPPVETLKDRMDHSDYDGVISINRAGSEVRNTVVPGYTTYEPVGSRLDGWGRYRTVYSRVRYPGYVERDRIVRLETTVWAAQSGGRMVWSGLSETVDPTSATDLGREVSRLIVPKLAKDGVLT